MELSHRSNFALGNGWVGPRSMCEFCFYELVNNIVFVHLKIQLLEDVYDYFCNGQELDFIPMLGMVISP